MKGRGAFYGFCEEQEFEDSWLFDETFLFGNLVRGNRITAFGLRATSALA